MCSIFNTTGQLDNNLSLDNISALFNLIHKHREYKNTTSSFIQYGTVMIWLILTGLNNWSYNTKSQSTFFILTFGSLMLSWFPTQSLCALLNVPSNPPPPLHLTVNLVTDWPTNLPVCGRWEETWALGGTERSQGECANSTLTEPEVGTEPHLWSCGRLKIFLTNKYNLN